MPFTSSKIRPATVLIATWQHTEWHACTCHSTTSGARTRSEEVCQSANDWERARSGISCCCKACLQ
eukprot:3319640-Lingulodinium_polyedra.AAC.1